MVSMTTMKIKTLAKLLRPEYSCFVQYVQLTFLKGKINLKLGELYHVIKPNKYILSGIFKNLIFVSGTSCYVKTITLFLIQKCNQEWE